MGLTPIEKYKSYYIRAIWCISCRIGVELFQLILKIQQFKNEVNLKMHDFCHGMKFYFYDRLTNKSSTNNIILPVPLCFKRVLAK